MKKILQVLNEAKEPLTQTEAILTIYDKEPLNEPRGLMLASSLTGGYLTGEWAMSFTRFKGKNPEKEYHPCTFADLLYARYSRSFKLLAKNGLIAWTHKKRFHYRYAKAYTITEKGKKLCATTEQPF